MIKKIHKGIFLILGYEQSKNLPALWKFSRGQKWVFPNKKTTNVVQKLSSSMVG